MQEEREAKGNQSKVRSIAGRWIAIAFSVFVIYSMATLRIQELQQLSLFLGFALALAFIHYPLHPGRPNFKPFILIDFVLAGLSFSLGLYILYDYWEFIFRVGIPTKWDITFSFLALVLVLEATRRAVGLPLLIIVLGFLLYIIHDNCFYISKILRNRVKAIYELCIYS